MNAMSLRHGEVVVPRVGRSNDCHAVFDLERITQQRGTAGGSSAERPSSVRNRGLNDIPGAPAPGDDKSIPASSDTREAVWRCIGIVDEVGGVLRVNPPSTRRNDACSGCGSVDPFCRARAVRMRRSSQWRFLGVMYVPACGSTAGACRSSSLASRLGPSRHTCHGSLRPGATIAAD
jgi:hypothetical protein